MVEWLIFVGAKTRVWRILRYANSGTKRCQPRSHTRVQKQGFARAAKGSHFLGAAAGEECLAAGPRLGRAHRHRPAAARSLGQCWRRTQSMPQNYAAGTRAQIQVQATEPTPKIINARRRSFEDDL
jgi:hypothetical protein